MSTITPIRDPAPTPDAPDTIEAARLAAAQACEAELQARGLSRGRAAREIDISAPRLSRWLAGTYPAAGVPGTTARVEAWLARIAEGDALSIAGAGLDRHARLEATRDVHAALAQAQATGDVALVTGPSGAGKTWAAQRYCARRASAIYLEVCGATVSHAGLLGLVAEAVGAGPRHASALAARIAAVAALRDRGALLVVDEAHHLSAALVDDLRRVRDMSGAGLALIGGAGLAMTVASRAEIAGRIGARLTLKAAAETDVRALAQNVLGRRPDKAERAALLAAARGPGGLHALRRLLTRAWTIARAEGMEHIGREELLAAAEDGAGGGA